MKIYAAGIVCWRVEKGQFKVLIVHRGQYNDWGWPKGKQDPGETLPVTAVRETKEEAGIKVRLGRKLTEIRYDLPKGISKEVHYWSSKVTDKELSKAKFKPNKEIDEIRWVDAQQAEKLLTYERDKELLAQTLELFESSQLETRAIIVLRHAEALPRSEWSKTDGDRPLTETGQLQAKSLTKLLAAFNVRRVVTSPWKRCLDTVKPFGKKQKLKIIERSQLSELGNQRNPAKTTRVIKDSLKEHKSMILCTHRPALPTVLDTISDYAKNDKSVEIHEGRTLAPAEMMVIRMSLKTRQVVGVETYNAPEVAYPNLPVT